MNKETYIEYLYDKKYNLIFLAKNISESPNYEIQLKILTTPSLNQVMEDKVWIKETNNPYAQFHVDMYFGIFSQ